MGSLFFWFVNFTLDDVHKVQAVNKGGWKFAKGRDKGSGQNILGYWLFL